MVQPKKRIVKPKDKKSTVPQISDEDKAVFAEVVKFEATVGVPWWTFAHPKESWAGFKRRGMPTTTSSKESTVKTTSFDAKAAARRISSHLQDAVGDIAADMLSPSSGFADDKWDKRIKKARKDRVRDLQGWLADELYNDPDTLQDLMGDKLYEECNGDRLKQLEVLNILRINAHAGLKKACDEIERNYLTN